MGLVGSAGLIRHVSGGGPEEPQRREGPFSLLGCAPPSTRLSDPTPLPIGSSSLLETSHLFSANNNPGIFHDGFTSLEKGRWQQAVEPLPRAVQSATPVVKGFGNIWTSGIFLPPSKYSPPSGHGLQVALCTSLPLFLITLFRGVRPAKTYLDLCEPL